MVWYATCTKGHAKSPTRLMSSAQHEDMPPGVISPLHSIILPSRLSRRLILPESLSSRQPFAPENNDDDNKMEPLKAHGGMPRCVRKRDVSSGFCIDSARTIGRLIWKLWCLLTLNFLIVHLMSSGAEDGEGAMTALRDLFTVIGVIESLLFSATVGPFLQLNNDMALTINTYYWATQLSAFFLIALLCSCLASLLLITVYLIYLHGVHKSKRLKEAARLPIFGLFLLTSLWSVLSATIWVLLRIYLFLPQYYFWGFVAMTLFLLAIDTPFLIYAFVYRMPHTHKNKRRSIFPATSGPHEKHLQSQFVSFR